MYSGIPNKLFLLVLHVTKLNLHLNLQLEIAYMYM